MSSVKGFEDHGGNGRVVSMAAIVRSTGQTRGSELEQNGRRLLAAIVESSPRKTIEAILCRPFQSMVRSSGGRDKHESCGYVNDGHVHKMSAPESRPRRPQCEKTTSTQRYRHNCSPALNDSLSNRGRHQPPLHFRLPPARPY
jgi:hypothetical protein